jgi:short-subunit dehydrogenase
MDVENAGPQSKERLSAMKNQSSMVWITGASSGLGKSLALEFDKLNFDIILSARNEEELEKVQLLCSGTGQKIVIPLDLSDSCSIDKAFKKAMQVAKNGIDLLINNGGISQRALGLETDLEVCRRIFEVNFFGTVQLTTLVAKDMVKRKKGHLVAISSIVGKFGSPLRSTYSASKHALHGYFDSLRFELAKDQVAVTLICPGFIATDIAKNALTATGLPQKNQDKKTGAGLSPELFAQRAVKAILHKKREVYIGKSEILAVYLKRFFPGLFTRVLSKVDVT